MSDTEFVRYYCIDCSVVSKWDFDMPVPVLVDSYYLDKNDWINGKAN